MIKPSFREIRSQCLRAWKISKELQSGKQWYNSKVFELKSKWAAKCKIWLFLVFRWMNEQAGNIKDGKRFVQILLTFWQILRCTTLLVIGNKSSVETKEEIPLKTELLQHISSICREFEICLKIYSNFLKS